MIRLESLSKEYDLPDNAAGPVLAADRLNLEIAAGQIYGLVGPNGAGKTTALKMVCGLLAPTSGRVTVRGIDVQRQPEEAQRYIGYLADFFSLYDDLKVWEYLDYFARAYKMPPDTIAGRIDYLLGLLHLEGKRDAFIAGLSRGMKQRLGIARAIIHDPPVLVLDEPAAGLDPQARIELKTLIRELNGAGKTVFITSHLLADLEEICTSIGVLEKGRLVRSGALAEILREATKGPGGAPARRVRIRLATPGFAVREWLGRHPRVASISEDRAGVEFAFSGTDAELAELTRALVAAGAPICGVETQTESLERVYSQLTKGEVM